MKIQIHMNTNTYEITNTNISINQVPRMDGIGRGIAAAMAECWLIACLTWENTTFHLKYR